MKVLLIFPPSTIQGEDPTMPSIVPPLGLAYVAAYLRKSGFDVEVLDARSKSGNRVIMERDNVRHFGLTDEELLAEIKAHEPDIVGVSCMYTAYSDNAHRCIRVAKSYKESVVTVMGGAHASTFSHLVLRDPYLDVVVHGEGEVTFEELVSKVAAGEDYHDIQGISYRGSNDAPKKNAIRPFEPNIDVFPFPARDLLNMEQYEETSTSTFSMRHPATTLITSRGCPQACIFCTIQSVWGDQKWRSRTAMNVVDEIEQVVDEYGIREFYILDDSAGASKRRLKQVCEEIIRRNIDIRWTTPNGIAHWTLDADTLDLMKESGCYRVTFGIESANLETRKYLGKPFPLEQAVDVIQHANKIGMWTICTNILGFPFETKESIMDTIEFNCTSGTDMAVFYLLCPHPGTAVYEDFKKAGLLNFDNQMKPEVFDSATQESLAMSLAGRGANTARFTPEELKEFVGLANKRFFMSRFAHFGNPMTLARKARSIEDVRYMLKVGTHGVKLATRAFTGKFFSQDITKHKHKNMNYEQSSAGREA